MFKLQAQVVQKVANAIHWINLYPKDSAIGVPNTLCPLANDFSSGYTTLASFSESNRVVFTRKRGNFGASAVTKYFSRVARTY